MNSGQMQKCGTLPKTNLCDHGTWPLQRDRQTCRTDRQTTYCGI